MVFIGNLVTIFSNIVALNLKVIPIKVTHLGILNKIYFKRVVVFSIYINVILIILLLIYLSLSSLICIMY